MATPRTDSPACMPASLACTTLTLLAASLACSTFTLLAASLPCSTFALLAASLPRATLTLLGTSLLSRPAAYSGAAATALPFAFALHGVQLMDEGRQCLPMKTIMNRAADSLAQTVLHGLTTLFQATEDTTLGFLTPLSGLLPLGRDFAAHLSLSLRFLGLDCRKA